MKAVITSLGSTGDVQPLLALAVEMRARGHEPVLAFSPEFRRLVEPLGFSLVPIGPALTTELLAKVQGPQLKMKSLTDQARHFIECIAPYVPGMFEEIMALCRQADVLIGVPFQPACRMVHDALGIPYVSINLSHFGSVGSKPLRDATAPILNECRVRLGLKPQLDPMMADGQSPQLVIYSVSRVLARRSPQWPNHHHITGFFFLDQHDWQPDSGLTRFIEQGPPPVLTTLGSAYCESPQELTLLLVEAAHRCGSRILIQQGWGGIGAGITLSDQVHVIGFAPHRLLMKMACCVIHHGGAGTTAAALRAGLPAVIIPHDGDQVIWAELVRGLGCAGPPLPHSALSVDRLAALLQSTLKPNMQVAARNVSRIIEEEHGVKRACLLIEECLNGTKSQPFSKCPAEA